MPEYYAWLYFEEKRPWWKRLLGLAKEPREISVKALLDTGSRVSLALPYSVAKSLKLRYTGNKIVIIGYGGRRTSADEAIASFKLKLNEKEFYLKERAVYISGYPEVIIGIPLMEECGIGLA